MQPVIHLHVHSNYTFLGALPSVKELAECAASAGLSHLALTDTNGLYGVVSFSQACHKVNVRPIVGMVTTVAAPAGLDTRAGRRWSSGLIVLLATGPMGYRSLCHISSLIQGHPDRKVRAAGGLALDDLSP